MTLPFFESMPDAVNVHSYVRHEADQKPEDERGVLVFRWSRKGVGFGEITFTTRDGKLRADTECMSDKFVLEIIAQALLDREEVG